MLIYMFNDVTTYAEQVQAGAAVDARGFVGSVDDSGLANLARLFSRASRVRLQDGGKVELQTLDELVLELNVGEEVVGGGPGLGEGDAIGTVGVLGLAQAIDGGLVINFCSSNAEDDVGGGGGLDFKGREANDEVLAQEVVGGLSEILGVYNITLATKKE